LVPLIDAIDEMLAGVDDMLATLIPAPVIGGDAATFEEVTASVTGTLTDLRATFNELNEAVISPVTQVFDDVKVGLVDIRTVVANASVTIPQYINTVSILSYLYDVAQPLTTVLEGFGPGEQLSAVVSIFSQVQDDVATALGPLAEGLQATSNAVKYFAGDSQEVLNNISPQAQAALQSLKDAANALRPVVHGFRKAEQAIAPLRWMLETASFFVDKVLTPMLQCIVQTTRLDGLVNDVKTSLLQKLEIGDVARLVQSNVNPTTEQAQGSNVSSQQGAKLADAFAQLSSALGQYRNNQSEALQNATRALITVITGTAIDPSKAAPIFPGGAVPQLNGSSTAPTAVSSALAASGPAVSGLQPEFNRVQAVHSANAGTLAVRPLVLTQVTTQVGNGGTCTALPTIDATAWPRSADLVGTLQELIGEVAQLSTDAQTLQASLASLGTSLRLPADFQAQVADMVTVLHTCSDLADSLVAFNFEAINTVTSLVQPVVVQQLQAVEAVTVAVITLQDAMEQLSTTSQSVLAAMPQTAVIDDTLNRLDGWVLALQQLIALVEICNKLDAQHGNQNAGDLAALKTGIEASATSLMGTLNGNDSAKQTGITGQVRAAGASVKSLQNALDAYSGALSGLSKYSQVISSQALPALQSTAHLMGTIDSIFDPLSNLLRVGNCVPGNGSTAKADAATAVERIIQAGQSAAIPPSDTFTNLANQFGEAVLPLGQIAQAVTEAATTISGPVVNAFQSQSPALTQALTSLSQLLQQTKSYEIKNEDGSVSNLANDIVDQAFVNQAKALLSKMPVSQTI
jgi:hypothetical protein